MMFNNKKSRNLSIVQPVEFVKIILTTRVTSTSRLSAADTLRTTNYGLHCCDLMVHLRRVCKFAPYTI